MNRQMRWLVVVFVTLFVPVAGWSRQSGSTVEMDRIFEALGVREGATICEIGAGDGELSLEAARLVGPTGRVYTSELGDERVNALRERVQQSELSQIVVVEGHENRTNFPSGACDAVFMRNVYHHFADPARMNASIAESLKPGGRSRWLTSRPRAAGRRTTRPTATPTAGTA